MQQFGQQPSRCLVGQMSLFSEDPHLQIIRIPPHFQHVYVVIGLQQQHVQPLQVPDRVLGIDSHIRCHGRALRSGLHTVAHRFGCVMRDRKRQDRQIPDLLRPVCLHLVEAGLRDLSQRTHALQLPDSPGRRIDRNAFAPCQHAQPLNMVRMLVRDQYGIDIGKRMADGVQRFFCPFAGDAAVDQDTGVVGCQVKTVAAAAACQTAEFHLRVPPAGGRSSARLSAAHRAVFWSPQNRRCYR